LHTDKAVDQLVRVIRDTDMRMRRDRLRWQALRNGEGEDGPGQFGDERPEDGVNEKEWERDRDQEWLLNGPTRREVGRRTSPEKERPEMPWRRNRTET
jgi:hypothetical protein